MNIISRLFGHLHTINTHRRNVRHLCIKSGLIFQGLTHDLSKYSPTEFISSVKYYQGYRSPIDAEKEDIGYSLCWLHHKGRNKHHFEYWYDRDKINIYYAPKPMPFNYLLESVCDKIGASKVYAKEKFDNAYTYNFFMHSNDRLNMEPYTRDTIEKLLEYYKDYGEEKALVYYKSLYRKFKKEGHVDL